MAKEADGDGSEKKKPATRRRLKEARKEGEVAQSKDLTESVQLVAWCAALNFAAIPFVNAWEDRLRYVLAAVENPSSNQMGSALASCTYLFVFTVLALLLPVCIVGLAIHFVQVGPILAGIKIAPSFGRLSPTNWFAKFTNWEMPIDLFKSVLKVILILWVGFAIDRAALPPVQSLLFGGPDSTIVAIARILMHLLETISLAGLVIGAGDLLYQRFVFLKNMRMTVSEHRRDRKVTEGDPRIKSKRKRLYREWSNYNAVEATRASTVVVTNPTHFAVALHYDPAVHSSPLVAAKGQDGLAAEIRRAAEDAKVPVIRNPPLARLLHERIEVDESVPEDLFTAVAEVIIWASRSKAAEYREP